MVDEFDTWLKNHTSTTLNPITGEVDPFLVMLWLHPVHIAVLATEAYREACANGTNCPQALNFSSAELDYYGDLSSMDVQIERIRMLLKEYNVFNNTFIWFTSDNGPAGPDAGTYGNSDWPGSANGLRGRKQDLWEGGIREPTILQWENGLISNINGYNSTFPIVTYDYLPTIMDILNITSDNPPNWELDGISLVNLLKDPINEEIKGRNKAMGWNAKSAAAWTRNNWKIVIDSSACNGSECNPALYNLENDPNETKNVTKNNLQIYNIMMGELQQWLISVNNSQYYDSKCAIKNASNSSVVTMDHVKHHQQDLTKLFAWFS